MSSFYSIREMEKLLGKARWKIDYAMRYHLHLKPDKMFGGQRVFSNETLQSLVQFFANRDGDKNEIK